jgi:hypothetical protein
MLSKEQQAAKEPQTASLKYGDAKPVCETFADGGRSVDKIGAFAGVSGRTVEKIAKVVEAVAKRASFMHWGASGVAAEFARISGQMCKASVNAC